MTLKPHWNDNLNFFSWLKMFFKKIMNGLYIKMMAFMYDM